MRVHELAKQINWTNKQLIDFLHGKGLEPKVPASSVDDKTIRMVYDSIQASKQPGEAPAAPVAGTKAKGSPTPPRKPPKPHGAPFVAQAEPVKEAPPKVDARAIALQKIAEAKARRDQMRQAAGTPLEPAPAPEKTILEAPAPQTIDLAPEPVAPVHAVAAPTDAATPPPPAAPPPVQPPAAPPHLVLRAPGSPPPAPRQPQRPAYQGYQAQRPGGYGDRPGGPPRPQGGYGDRPGGPPRPQGGYGDRPGAPRQPLRGRSVELEQLPGLPKRVPPQYARGTGRDAKLDLTLPPSIEVMKLRPARRPGPLPGKKVDSEEEKLRKKGLRAKAPSVGDKKIRPGKILNLDAIEDVVPAADASRRIVRPRSNVLVGPDHRQMQRQRPAALPVEPKIAKIRGDLTVAEFAEKIGVPATEVITKAFLLGEALTLNKLIRTDLCELLAADFNVRIEIVPEGDEYDMQDLAAEADEPAMQAPRPPVVTIMGHVDHGKTTLLDAIRKTNVAGGEFGGITQHIGAYHVQTDRGEVVFLDTPGHEAFTAMRARGASVTDIVVLIVAADDGLMPQTVEAINHARAAKVPIIVAINKIDLPGANATKIRNDLMQYSLLGEELGGDTIICEVSAKQGTGIDNLLEMILLQAEVLELKANPALRAQGIVIESKIDPQRGISATILVERGTLRAGDAFVCGDVSGRVRIMRNDRGEDVDHATPAHPVEILGLDGCPQVGERFAVVESERQARQIAAIRETRRRRQHQNAALRPHVTLEGLSDYLNQDDKPKVLNLILKGDVQGSVEAVSQALARLTTEKVTLSILHSGVGSVNESDVQLAMASDAVIIGFNVRPDTTATELARVEGIDIKTYRIIYNLLEEMRAAMLGMLDKKFKEVARGRAEIRQIFRVSRLGNIAGCYVQTGTLQRNDKLRLVRDGAVVFEGEFHTLRRLKEDVNTVQAGFECGVTFKDFQDIREGDVIETYAHEEVSQTL